MTGLLRFLLLPLLALAAFLDATPAGADEAPREAEATKPATEKGDEPEAKAPAPRRPMLWEVDTHPKIYLFGTIHLGDPRVLDHPPVVEKALAASEAVYTEIVLEPTALMEIAPLMRLPEGETLKTILPSKLHARLQDLYREKGVSDMMLQGLDRLQPWAIYLQLQTLDVDPKMQGQALDMTLFMEAKQGGKTVGGLETMREQVDIFATLTRAEQIQLLEASVTAIEQARKTGANPIQQLVDLYLAGDADRLMEAMKSQMQQGDKLSEKLMKRMLDDRNVVMVRRMLERAQEHPEKTMFVAVGAGHMPGERGIVRLLQDTGFRVRKVDDVADLEKPWPLEVRATGSASGSTRRAPRIRHIRVGPFCIPVRCCR